MPYWNPLLGFASAPVFIIHLKCFWSLIWNVWIGWKKVLWGCFYNREGCRLFYVSSSYLLENKFEGVENKHQSFIRSQTVWYSCLRWALITIRSNWNPILFIWFFFVSYRTPFYFRTFNLSWFESLQTSQFFDIFWDIFRSSFKSFSKHITVL